MPATAVRACAVRGLTCEPAGSAVLHARWLLSDWPGGQGMQSGGHAVALELLDPFVQFPCRCRPAEHRSGKLRAHQPRPAGEGTDPLRRRERQHGLQRGGCGVERASAKPDGGQVNARQRLRAEPVLFARARPLGGVAEVAELCGLTQGAVRDLVAAGNRNGGQR
jgi:hypothetical protein